MQMDCARIAGRAEHTGSARRLKGVRRVDGHGCVVRQSGSGGERPRQAVSTMKRQSSRVEAGAPLAPAAGALVFAVGLLAASACGKTAGGPPDAARGRAAYMSNCAACHGPDPAKDGAIGPAIQGASQALLEARVLRATYPPGITPKRTTHTMVALPHVAAELPHLGAYLGSK
ncbi:MAG: c-type cytochrome [Myxococcales bacterium]|nr:c-type cytochrome [Myxococcales bacterium]